MEDSQESSGYVHLQRYAKSSASLHVFAGKFFCNSRACMLNLARGARSQTDSAGAVDKFFQDGKEDESTLYTAKKVPPRQRLALFAASTRAGHLFVGAGLSPTCYEDSPVCSVGWQGNLKQLSSMHHPARL